MDVPTVLQAGTTVANYRVDRLLGRGGMGAVFLAYDMTLQRQVALKVMTSPADDQRPRSLLLREARNAAALNHVNICTVYEVGDANGAAFIAMEYVDGPSLRERLDAGALIADELLRYAIQAADALAYAHARGVIHRDFKAANVMLLAEGRLKVVDFGLARRDDALTAAATTMASLAEAGAAAGTPYAMAPEQIRGEPADERTDIWALGVLLYEMASGAQPFTASTLPDLFSRVLRDAPAPLPGAVPIDLRVIIERCLEKDPARRYQRASDVSAALAAIQRGSASPWAAWRYRVRRNRWLAAGVTLLAVAAVGLTLEGGRLRQRLTGAAVAPIRLAVLPFENLTGDPEQEFFTDGLTEEMITQLGRVRPDRLSVIARTSAMRYKNRAVPVDQIGRELGVKYVLEGSARREGARVRISTTLIDVTNQTQQWTDTFDRELASILAVESDVARGVTGALAIRLLPAEDARLAAARPVNPEAYEAYLRGRSHVIKNTRADLDAAMSYFELALAKDPQYSLAYAGIAQVWSGRQQFGFVPAAEAAPQMKAAVAKAGAIDDGTGDVHLRLAIVYTWTDWNWADAEPEFKKAIAAAPSLAEAHAFYAHYLYIMRRPDEGLAEIRRAVEIDPLSENVQSLHGTTLIWTGKFEEALANARNVLRTNPDSPQALNQQAVALRHLKRWKESLDAEIQWWKARNDTEVVAELERGYAEGGYQAAMRGAAAVLAARPQGRGANLTRLATTYARAGDVDHAIESLERAMATRDPNIPYLSTGPEYDALRGDPRFQSLVRRLNLPL